MNTPPTNTRTLHVPAGKQRPLFVRQLRRFLLHRHFALLWGGQTVSTFCSYITSMGLPIAAWLLLHATPAQIGLLTALTALPGLVLGLLIGVWVDRLPRRFLMIAADLGRALLLVSLPLAAMFGLLHLALFYVVAVLVGLLTTCFEVASLSFLPVLLQPEDLITGNSRLSTSNALAEIAGPPLAGVIIRILTAPVAILLDVLSFLLSALCVSLIRVAEAPREASPQRLQLWREICEGFSVLLGSSPARPGCLHLYPELFRRSLCRALPDLRAPTFRGQYAGLRLAGRLWGSGCACGLVLRGLVCTPLWLWSHADRFCPVTRAAFVLHSAGCWPSARGFHSDGAFSVAWQYRLCGLLHQRDQPAPAACARSSPWSHQCLHADALDRRHASWCIAGWYSE